MARQLRLYSGINPNQNNNLHYFFGTPSLYISELQNHLIATIPIDNYRINLNTAKVALKNDINMGNFEKVTYIIDYDNETNYFKCYYVDSILLQDYAIYNLSVDLWATYMCNASFSNIHVTRCNRALNEHGEYDDVSTTYTRQEQNANFVYTAQDGTINDDQVFIVYLVEYNVEQSAIWGDQHVSTTGLFASRLSALRGEQVKSAVEVAIDMVGGITKIANDKQARVLQAWLLPQWLVDIGQASGDIQQSKYYVFNSKGKDGTYQFDGYLVNPSHKSMDLIGNTFELDYATFIGTRNNCYKTKRFVNKYMNDIALHAFVGTNSLQVVLIQGDDQKDVTKDFEVALTTNNGEVTGLRAVASVIGKTLTSTLGVVGAMKKENYYDVAKQVTGGATSQIETKPAISSAVGSGDASNLYWRPIWPNETDQDVIKKLNFPIIKERFRSTRDEEMHARMQGANFDEYISGFNYPLTKALLGTGNNLTFEYTYIVASCTIEGVPSDAKNLMTNKLNTGIYYKVLTI